MKNGASFIFDKKDENLIRAHTWSIARGHIRTTINGKTAYLHRLLLGVSDDIEIDHINLDKADNRRQNLRYATHSENQMNRGLRKDNSSGYKGVCFDKRSKKYISYINANGKRRYLGYYDDKFSAAMAYDLAAERLHGKFAKFNLNKEEQNENDEVLELDEPNGQDESEANEQNSVSKRSNRRRELV